MVERSLAGALFAWTTALLAQTPAKVDFARDIQPIFQANCVSCHGPSQQMAGFRIDQRRYALPNTVGANGVRIVPGNIGRSRLFQKIVGSGSGLRMPPTEPLSPEQIDIIKAWIEQGADWPEELSGEISRVPPDPKVVQMMDALRTADRQNLEKLLRATPKTVNSRGPGGSTPLMYAALYGDADCVRRLLKSGADSNLRNDAGATALMWATDDAEKTRVLLEGGADPNLRSGEGRTALMMAAGRFSSGAVVRLLLDHGADPLALSPQGQSAARVAALAGDEDVLRILIARGADEKSTAGALSSAVQSRCIGCIQLLIDKADPRALNRAMTVSAMLGDEAALKMVLDRGADVNVPDPAGDGASALILAAGSESATPATVRLLVERGADLHARNASGETAFDVATRAGAAPIADLLKKAGAPETGTAAVRLPAPKPAKSIRAAMERSIPPLQRTDVAFFKKSGCISCHNNSLAAMMLAAARRYQIPVNEDVAQDQVRITATYIETWRERVLQGVAIPGGQDTISYILLGLAAANYQPDASTDALARFLKNTQRPTGEWRIGAHRQPIESSDIEVTAASLRAVQRYTPKAWQPEYEKAVQRAAAWLAKAQPKTTEDRVFQLLGLSWAGASRDIVRKLAREFLTQQRSDGGWAQLPALQSDAYATGEALVALNQVGQLDATDARYRRGTRFLMDTQLEDGSWYVRSRALAVQPYFDSDFPHGRDQFISAAATNWAVMALAPAAR
jgi:ankyrin repeat protein/cytochrome c551/c552